METQFSKDGNASQVFCKQWILYVLRCSDDSLYTGITNDLHERLAAHNSGRGAKYTRSRKPCEVVAVCKMKDKSSSLKAEYRFKQLSRTKKLDAIESGLESLFPEYLHADQNHRDANRDQCLGLHDRFMKEPPREEWEREIGRSETHHPQFPHGEVSKTNLRRQKCQNRTDHTTNGTDQKCQSLIGYQKLCVCGEPENKVRTCHCQHDYKS